MVHGLLIPKILIDLLTAATADDKGVLIRVQDRKLVIVALTTSEGMAVCSQGGGDASCDSPR